MKRLIASSLVILGLVIVSVNAQVDKNNCRMTKEDVDNCTFAITTTTDRPIGSGISVIRNDKVYILTDAHCIIDGNKYKIVKRQYDDTGEEDFYVSVNAELWAFDKSLDFAILKCNKSPGGNVGSTKFYLSDKVYKVGTDIFNVGHFLAWDGQVGATSYSTGIVSQINRQTNYNNRMKMDLCLFLSCIPGCSGSGVYNTNGECIGLVCAGVGGNDVLINPVREIKKWCANKNISWLIDEKLPVPPEEEIKKLVPSVEKQLDMCEQVMRRIFGS